MSKQQKTIGILALQGAFVEHQRMLDYLRVNTFLIRNLSDIKDKVIDGIILPGGESTTIIKMLNKTSLYEWLINMGQSGVPIFGTCAGMIILSLMELIDIEVNRNSYGSQLNSFEEIIDLSDGSKFTGIFIRAPKVIHVGNNVEVIAKYVDVPVLVKQKNILAASFHPELTNDTRVHEIFLGI